MVLYKEVIGFDCPSVCEWWRCCDVLLMDLLLGWKGNFQVIWGVVMSWAVVAFGDLCGLWKEFALKLALCFLWIFLDSLRLVNGDCLQVSRVFLERLGLVLFVILVDLR